jgi:hypothetical protein
MKTLVSSKLNRRVWIFSTVALVSAPIMAARAFARMVGLPPFDDVEQVVDRYYVAQKDLRPTDIITQKDGAAIFDQLKRIGWDVADQKLIMNAMLPENAFLVTTLRSPYGKRFMRKSSSFDTIYDRLDRVSEQPGGKQLIADLVKLPNGEQFAKLTTDVGDPDLIALLPKDANGFNRQIPNGFLAESVRRGPAKRHPVPLRNDSADRPKQFLILVGLDRSTSGMEGRRRAVAALDIEVGPCRRHSPNEPQFQARVAGECRLNAIAGRAA